MAKSIFVYDGVKYLVLPQALECHPIIVLRGGKKYQIINIHKWGKNDPLTPVVSLIKYESYAPWRPGINTRKQTIASRLRREGFKNVFIARRTPRQRQLKNCWKSTVF